ncbi:hypothetical protein SAMN02745664_12413 [Moraxella cuniculi DSM 21768]|uniref:Uncharacterized protein n=1 Tax=Moraxella cuniculi DSM 21768 TaxID=1122245 RepID=A0A1N7G6E7_9GAMM|nr:hypothetical protein [Moraxella cuniculi]OOS04354.1 hypothetical protein B0189_08565 [Moraxella cuniculi]SIS08187.1 hypothetical protein SAMN02745664_12413 [Moraxella cuniculi DSM 21768]
MNTEKITATTLIIDALLARMSRLERYSDEDDAICNADLDKLDVVFDDNSGKFGLVVDVSRYGYKDGRPDLYRVDFMNGDFVGGNYISTLLQNDKNRTVRTIYETEARKARQTLLHDLTYVFDVGAP